MFLQSTYFQNSSLQTNRFEFFKKKKIKSDFQIEIQILILSTTVV